MNITQTKEVLKTLIETRTKITPMLWAKHGIGKSSIVSQLAQELDYKMFSILLSQKEAVDVAGVLYTFVDNDLNMSVTASHPPQWFANALKNGKVVLFLDEFNMARREVLNAAFELVLDRRLNNMSLPDSVFIVCAGNPEDDRYDVTPLSESLRDRLMHIHVRPDVNSWLEWAKGKMNKDIVRFIENTPTAAYSYDERDDKFPVEIKHSFRSWERANAVYSLPLNNTLKLECLRGIIGQDLAVAFMRMNQTSDVPISPEVVLNDPITASEWVGKIVGENPMRVDLLNATVQQLVTFCNEKTNVDVAVKQKDNVISFLKHLPSDLTVMAIHGLRKLPTYADSFMGDKEIHELLLSVNKLAQQKQQQNAAVKV